MRNTTPRKPRSDKGVKQELTQIRDELETLGLLASAVGTKVTRIAKRIDGLDLRRLTRPDKAKPR